MNKNIDPVPVALSTKAARLLAPLLVWLALPWSAAVLAQVAPDAGRTLQTVPQQAAPVRPDIKLEVGPETRPAMPETPGIAVRLKAFRLSGNRAIAEPELAALLADLVGRELSFADLTRAAQRLTDHYRGRGYLVAQAYLPTQDIRDGVVEIAILEGMLGEVKLTVRPGVRVSEPALRGMLAAVVPGTVIHESNVERTLLLMHDLPGVATSSTLVPGAQIGAADLQVDVEEHEHLMTGSVDLDNWGNRFTGEFRASGSLAIASPFGIGDQILGRAMLSNGSKLRLGEVNYALPLGYSGIRAGVGYRRLEYSLGKSFANLQSHGDARVFSGFVQYPFLRTRQMNLSGNLGFDLKRLSDKIDSVGAVTDKNARSLRFSLTGDSRDQWKGGGANSFSLALTRGDLEIETPAARAFDQGVGGRFTEGAFGKLNYDVSRQQVLYDSLGLFVSLSGQLASKNLDSSEKFSLGGPTGVRAYPVGEAAGDQGYLITGELRYALQTRLLASLDASVFAFYDAGGVRANRNPLQTDTTNVRNLAAVGVGALIAKAGSFFVRTSLAWRVEREQPLSDIDRGPRLWLQISVPF